MDQSTAFRMWTVCRSSHRCCELRHRCGRCVAARIIVASCDIELPSQNEQSHPSRNVLAGHPKQLTFSWTTEKKEESSRSPKTLPNYDCVCTYACIFPINREKSHLALFSYDITVDLLSRHTHTHTHTSESS